MLFSLASGERVSFSCVAKRKAPLRCRSSANGVAGPQGEGQEPGVKRRPPHTRALRTVPVLQVRVPAEGFADSPSMDWRRTGPHRVGRPLDNSGNCSCVALPPAFMQSPWQSRRDRGDPSSAHRARRSQKRPRQLLLSCSTSCIHAVVVRPLGHLLPLREGNARAKP